MSRGMGQDQTFIDPKIDFRLSPTTSVYLASGWGRAVAFCIGLECKNGFSQIIVHKFTLIIRILHEYFTISGIQIRYFTCMITLLLFFEYYNRIFEMVSVKYIPYTSVKRMILVDLKKFQVERPEGIQTPVQHCTYM